ncbi:mitochondrial potassium channel [Halictus rubicundus]|uniref:mitochondrial potassium channel n=1 Tax=Halictus rubicundus TaxID=77578 RepID=UPI00403740DC
MAEKVRLLLKTLSSEINKHNLFNNARTTVNNATEKAQEKLNNIQNTVTAKYDVVAKQVGKDITMLQNVNTATLEPSVLPKKFVIWWQWYQKLTGLDKVEMAKHQVIIAQDVLFKCQDERRNLNRQATIINNKLNEVYSELIQTRRDDPKYVQLTIIENKSLQDQARIISELNLLEKEEKEHFTLLMTAIKEYHDNQTIHAQNYKYLSMLASAVVAIVSLIGSMIYNNMRNANIRNVMLLGQEKNEKNLQNALHSIEDNINVKFTKIINKMDNDVNKPSLENLGISKDELKETAYKFAIRGLVIYVLYRILMG